MAIKKKFTNFFDIGLLGFVFSAFLKDNNYLKLFKKGAKLYAENVHYAVSMTKEKRSEINKEILNIAAS